jgi:hypothetical protein
MAHYFLNSVRTMKAFVNKVFSAWLFLVKVSLTCGAMMVVSTVVAHTYFFAVSDMHFNEQSKRVEIIHQFTAHDIENTIAEIKHTNFSPEHPQYDAYVQAYFEQHFTLVQGDNKKQIKLYWIGFEVKRGSLYAYQESEPIKSLDNVIVENTVLTTSFPKQINTVNYQCINDQDGLKKPTNQNQSLPAMMQTSLTFDSNTPLAMLSIYCH